MSLESIFKGILGMGLGTHRILSTHPEEGKLDHSRATHLHPVGCRIQATSYKMQYTSLEDAQDAMDAGCKDA